jgi:hypothetical protein
MHFSQLVRFCQLILINIQFAFLAGGASRGEANLSGMSKQYAARDMPANKTLKYREKGQHTQDELRQKDREGIRRELEERERNVRDKQRPSSDTKRITSAGTTTSRSKPSISHTETNIDAEYVKK